MWIWSVWLDRNDCYWKPIFPVRAYYYAVMNLIYCYVFRSTSGLLWPARPSMLTDWEQSRLMGLSNSLVVLSSEPTRWIYPLTLLTRCWILGLTLLHSWWRSVHVIDIQTFTYPSPAQMWTDFSTNRFTFDFSHLLNQKMVKPVLFLFLHVLWSLSVSSDPNRLPVTSPASSTHT